MLGWPVVPNHIILRFRTEKLLQQRQCFNIWPIILLLLIPVSFVTNMAINHKNSDVSFFNFFIIICHLFQVKRPLWLKFDDFTSKQEHLIVNSLPFIKNQLTILTYQSSLYFSYTYLISNLETCRLYLGCPVSLTFVL